MPSSPRGGRGPRGPRPWVRASASARVVRPRHHLRTAHLGSRGMPTGPALLTDRYELTMVAAALADGTADRDCVFEVFARRLPHGRRYGVLAGTGRLLDALSAFCFTDEDLAALRAQGLTDTRLLDWLAGFRFSGDVDGYAEGELFFPGSPVLTVRAPFAEGVLLETLGRSALNHDRDRQ